MVSERNERLQKKSNCKVKGLWASNSECYFYLYFLVYKILFLKNPEISYKHHQVLSVQLFRSFSQRRGFCKNSLLLCQYLLCWNNSVFIFLLALILFLAHHIQHALKIASFIIYHLPYISASFLSLNIFPKSNPTSYVLPAVSIYVQISLKEIWIICIC